MIIALVFGVLYALVLVPAVSNLVALPVVYEALGIGAATPWPVLVVGVALPVVGYVLATLLARRRPVTDRAIVLAAGLALTWALSLSLVALVAAIQPPLV